jgi:flagellar biogenesis protein FliO
MRTARNILLSMALALCVATAASARQDRPLFKPGTAPAQASAEKASPEKASIEQGSLASGGVTRSFTQELLPTALALGATLLVIVLARSAIKRFGGKLPGARRPEGVVSVLARYPVARGQQIVLLKVGRRVIVANQGAQGMQTLSEFSAEADVADLVARCEASDRAKSPFSFDALLRQSDKNFDGAAAKGAHTTSAAKSTTTSTTKPATRSLDARDALPALLRDAEIETVDLTKRKRGGA